MEFVNFVILAGQLSVMKEEKLIVGPLIMQRLKS